METLLVITTIVIIIGILFLYYYVDHYVDTIEILESDIVKLNTRIQHLEYSVDELRFPPKYSIVQTIKTIDGREGIITQMGIYTNLVFGDKERQYKVFHVKEKEERWYRESQLKSKKK